MIQHVGGRLKALLLACSLVAAGSVANAGDFKPYIGIGGGFFSTEYSEQRVIGGVKLNKNSWGAFLKAGIDYQRFLGAEFRLGGSGKVSDSFSATIGAISPINVSAQATTFISYLLKGQLPLAQRLKLYALLGGTAARFRVTSSGGVTGSTTTWKSSISYGAGAEYRFRSRGSIGIEWVQYWNRVPLSVVSFGTSKGSLSGASIVINKYF